MEFPYYRVDAVIDENTPEACKPHIGRLTTLVVTHAEGCRCVFVPERRVFNAEPDSD